MISEKVLVVVAHPDDESLLFSSVIMRYSPDVICVTCGTNQEEEAKRESEFLNACFLLGANNVYNIKMRDIINTHLNIDELEDKLRRFIGKNSYDYIFTHSILGDINEHPHHQDVALVVSKIFNCVWINAWNMYAEMVNQLTIAEYELKKFVLGTIYEREYRRIRPSYEISSIEIIKSEEIFHETIFRFPSHFHRAKIPF